MRTRSSSTATSRAGWLAALAAILSAPAAVFGQSAIFADGFESGSFCAWDGDLDSIDPASLVASSSSGGSPLAACLVAGSAARLLVWTDLRDFEGDPIAGASVTIEGSPATPSTAQPGIYHREIVATAAVGARPLAFEALACGETVPLAGTITLDQVVENGTDGGLGGCASLDGNVRVRVLAAESGLPVAGAHVLLGDVEGTPLEHGADAGFGGASLPATNVAVTDAAGIAAFYDYGVTLTQPLSVTAGADDRAYFTVAGASASDLVLPLPLLHPPAPSTSLYSAGTAAGGGPWPPTGCNDMDFGFVSAEIDLDRLGGSGIDTLFGAQRCWDSQNALVGVVPIPANLYMPVQSIGPLCFGGSLAEATWSLELVNSPPTVDVGLVLWSAPYADVQAALSSGDWTTLVAIATERRIGFLLDETVSAPVAGRSFTMSETYPNSFTVTFSGHPAETDVVGNTAGDYSGANGTGPLFLLGSAVHAWDQAGSSLAIPNSDLNAAGMPSGVRRLASMTALYLDPDSRPNPPGPERRAASSTVLVRGGESPPFGPTGGAGTFGDFLGFAGATFAAPRTFLWDDATGNGEAPELSLHELVMRTDRHLPVLSCQTTNEVRPDASVQWIVARPFGATCAGQECFTLPELPPGFPLAGSGPGKKPGFEARIGSGAACTTTCDLAGEACVDPDDAGPAPLQCMGGSGTAEDPWFTQQLEWRLRVDRLELALQPFDFDAHAFTERLLYLTHESANRIPLD
jgi:hypothetical protein